MIVDCIPTAGTLRLLALPEALGWYTQPILPVERRPAERAEAAVRLVLTPEQVVLAAARRSWTTLALFGCRAGARPYRFIEPIGVAALTELTQEVYDGADPLTLSSGDGPFSVVRTSLGPVLELAVPAPPRPMSTWRARVVSWS